MTMKWLLQLFMDTASSHAAAKAKLDGERPFHGLQISEIKLTDLLIIQSNLNNLITIEYLHLQFTLRQRRYFCISLRMFKSAILLVL